MSSKDMTLGCEFGDDCEGSLRVAHQALAEIARNVEENDGCCDGDEGEADVVRGVRCLIERLKEDAASDKPRQDGVEAAEDVIASEGSGEAMERLAAALRRAEDGGKK